MAEVIFKKDGVPVDIDHIQKKKYPYLEHYLKSLKIIVDQVKNINNIDVEVNVIEQGELGNELLLDSRLDTKKIKKNLESFNKLKAIAIYYVGLNGYFLLEKYKDHNICYIQLQQTYEINMIRIAFHEVQHFSDPFIPREWQDILEDGLIYINYEKTIRAYIRLGLNEYFANLWAFSKCLDLINELVKNKKEDSIIEMCKKALIERIPSYLSNSSIKLNMFIKALRSGEMDNKKILNHKAEVILFLWSKFFHDIYYFIGGWKVYEDRELDTKLIQRTWDDFMAEIQNTELYNMIPLLNSFKKLLLGNFETHDDMVISIEHIFFEYYLTKLETDFLS